MDDISGVALNSRRTAADGGVPTSELQDIHKSFGAVKAQQGAQLSLHPGEVTALVGENRAGKSTMVRTLAAPGGPWPRPPGR